MVGISYQPRLAVSKHTRQFEGPRLLKARVL